MSGSSSQGPFDQAARFFDRSFPFRVFLLLALLSLILWRHVGACAGSSDTSGYLNDAKLLVSGNLHPAQRAFDGLPPEQFSVMGYVPLGFLPRKDGLMYPTYAMGFPMLIVLGSKIFGWAMGPNVVMGLHAILCIVAFYFLGCAFQLDREYSLLGAIILGSSVLFLFMSLQAMSDVPATLWSVLTLLFMAKADRQFKFAALSGLLFTYGIMVRPTGVLMIVPIACLLPLRAKPVTAFIIGMVPGVLALFILNSALYGQRFTTGYGDVSNLFSSGNVMPSIVNYIKWVPIELTPLVLLVFGFPFIRNRLTTRQLFCLLSWILVLFGFYSTYKCTQETWWYLRFVLPAYPALIILALHALNALSSKVTHRQFVCWIAVALLVAAWNWQFADKLNALDAGNAEEVYPETCEFINKHMPEGAVICCMQESGAIYYYTKHPVARYDFIEAKNFSSLVKACAKNNRKIYMVLFPFEEDTALKKFPGAVWERIGSVRFVTIWALSAASQS